MENARKKFQGLLRELFQFDCADLDFGIYRIMNQKRALIEQFIEKDLLDAVAKELKKGSLKEQVDLAEQLAALAAKIREDIGDDAIDADGKLDAKHAGIRLGRQYLELQQKATGASSIAELESQVFNHLWQFFSRYYDNGDFLSTRRYSRREKYAIPYNGEEVYLHWANRDQYYIKTGEYFTDYQWKAGRVAQTIWNFEEVGHTQEAKKQLIEMGLIGDDDAVFSTAKPTRLIDRILTLAEGCGGEMCLDFFAGTGSVGHAAVDRLRANGVGIAYMLVEMSVHFDTILKPRIQKVVFPSDWKDGKPVLPNTGKSSSISHAFKYIRLESYEDALGNIAFDGPQGELKFDDYVLRYLLEFETRKSETLLNVEKLTEGADDVFVNADGVIPGARVLDPVFKERMFAPVNV